MHSILSSSKFYRLNWNWSIVEQDFLEVPSMMFEKWVYYPEVTKQISGLYTNPLESLPDDLRERIIESKNVGFAILTRRLIFMSIFDLEIHSDHSRDSKEELSELWRNLLQKYYLPHELDTTPYSSWQHMTSGYNAGYYGYLWSEVFSYDLFSEFKQYGLFNKDLGIKLRKNILEPCAILTANEMFERFLGRKPNNKAFYEEYGLQQ